MNIDAQQKEQEPASEDQQTTDAEATASELDGEDDPVVPNQTSSTRAGESKNTSKQPSTARGGKAPAPVYDGPPPPRRLPVALAKAARTKTPPAGAQGAGETDSDDEL